MPASTVAAVGVVTLAASITVAVAQEPAHAPACGVTLPPSVRIMDCRLAVAVSEALPRSSTLSGLTDRIDSLHGLVYVTTTVELRRRNNHRLLGSTWNTVVAAGSRWIIRVAVERRYDDDGIALVGHELQHVIELLDSPEHRARGDAATDGIRETSAAQVVQRTVIRELRDARR